MLDLDQYDTVKLADDGVEFELLSPRDNTPLNAFITVIGTDSKVYRKAQMAAQNRRLQTLQKRNAQRLTAEELDAEALDIVVNCTTAWRNMGKGGTDLPYSKEKVREVYVAFPWIRKQVEEAMNDQTLFFAKGEKP